VTKGFNIKGFISTSLIDWPGKICSVVFLGGCGFRCPACHNSRLVLEPNAMPDYPLIEILNRLSTKGNWIDGVTITGGEPTMREELPKLLRLVKATGVSIKLDTNGSRPEVLERLISKSLIDAVFMDVKGPLNEAAYSKVAGVRVDIATIRRSIDVLKRSGLEVVFRTTAIPGLVEEPELERIVDALGDVQRFLIQPFRNQETLDPAFRSIPEFDRSRFDEMRDRYEISAQRPYVARPVARAG
jgi:pyruvate formate lyase activating enzyme